MKGLFNNQLNFDNNNELELVLDNLNHQMAIQIIEIGLQHANFSGSFNMAETHSLYKSLQYLKNHEHTDNNLRTDDSDGNHN
jgi:hypothetical protein